MSEQVYDRVLFGMPNDPELYLAALAAVQDYGWQLVRQWVARGSQGEWLLAIHSPNPQLDFLKVCYPTKGEWFEETVKDQTTRFEVLTDTVFVDEWEPCRGDWDYVYQFDTQAAYQIGQTIDTTAATVFGLLIGAGPDTEFPNLDKLQVQHRPGIMVLDTFDESNELCEMLENHYPELVTVQGEDENLPGYVFDMVIGPKCLTTYMAASMGKRVVELYPTDLHPKWLSKWSGKKYQQIIGEEFPVGLIWRAIEAEMEKWQTSMITT